jgi:hypothetical protein
MNFAKCQGEPRAGDSLWDSECNRLWLLKNSPFDPNVKNSGDRKCLAILEDRLQGILAQFHFGEFCKQEFFNTHA